jgi:hypothetical protein
MAGEAVLFAFDGLAFPKAEGVSKRLISGTPLNACLRPGPANSHDERACYYGSVVRVAEGDFRMWYLGVNDTERKKGPRGGFRICYAASKDGLTWEKPKLGLVDFAGSKENNIVDFPAGPNDLHEPIVVLHEPDDPDPQRRFKMLFEYLSDASWGTAASADGLRWKLLTDKRLTPWFEMSGVTRHRGRYYVTGQGGFPQPEPFYRRLGVYMSDDFVNWRFAGVGLDRSPSQRRPDYHFLRHEQVHLGAGLSNRGNVILGVYGQWHGVPEGKELVTRNMTGDLGLALSHDGVRFAEPVPGFAFIAEKAEQPPAVSFPYARVLMQGQGMYNVGNRTLCWYAYWSGPEVRVAAWERDRLGYLTPTGKAPTVASCPVRVATGSAKVYINARVAKGGDLKVSLLDNDGKAIPGFCGASVTGDQLRKHIVWPGGKALTAEMGSVRIQVSGPDDWRLYALYIGDAEPRAANAKQ